MHPVYWSIIIIVVCSVALLMYHHVNRYKRMDRFFYENNQWLYILLQFCYWLLFVSFVLNLRYIAYVVFAFIVWKYTGYHMKLT